MDRKLTVRFWTEMLKSRHSACDPIADFRLPMISWAMEGDHNAFWRTSAEELDALAHKHGFKRKGKQNWVRRTSDFVQLINLQRSQWASEGRYLNFALWPLALGEPRTIAESKFHFRTRAESIGATDLNDLFLRADTLTTLVELSAADAAGHVPGLMTRELRSLLRRP